MVFSQTSLKAQSLLKVVEIDRLKSEKNQQVNGLNGVVVEPAPMATTSYSEDFIKSEEEFKSEMFYEDREFFQDLVQWCAPPVEPEALQSIDFKLNEERTLNTDTPHTHLSPPGWVVPDPAPAPGFGPASPSLDDFINIHTDPFDTQHTHRIPFQEQFLDISSLPVVIRDTPAPDPWAPCPTYTPFIEDDSLDAKFPAVPPQAVEPDFLAEYVLDELGAGRARPALAVDVSAAPWPAAAVSTPDVLNCVEALETEKCPLLSTRVESPVQDVFVESTSTVQSPAESPPVTPKSEQRDTDDERTRRRRRSEDSDETYTPHAEPRRYKRRKPSIPIQDMIKVLEGSQNQPRARRGRPPKRRDSALSTISENSSTVSTHETKYRELRDKNNEASKRSRMNRKLKELQMEQLADDLEERNKKLRVRADLLEDMTRKLREAFMTAVAQKKGS